MIICTSLLECCLLEKIQWIQEEPPTTQTQYLDIEIRKLSLKLFLVFKLGIGTT